MGRIVKQELGVDTFDPMNIDISEFNGLAESIPADGSVDMAVAPQLAAQFLRAADRCSTILSTLVWHEQQAKDEKKRAFSRAVILAKESNTKMTDSIAKHKAEIDTNYIIACEKSIQIESVKTYFKNKHESLLRAHHLMKDILRGEQRHLKASGISERNWDSEKKTGEGEWDD